MRVLGIETSCDETAIAVVEDRFTLRANLVASQVDLHRRFGGVVPEVAARAHVETLNPLLEQTLDSGFTTVRDAFGIDWGFAQALERGLLRGPRVLFVGPCLSQTGGQRSHRPVRIAYVVARTVFGPSAS